ncbi:hypothetical protein KUG02_01070 [Streptococcus equi subsp. zooepidemicus]|uniref:hypothetical protein n=1 Tax=Streptococcus equi TaxID=1336 RepID=UPI0013F5A165|nr:hypothetical protein [Streptococcus equi]MCD3373295.1 hypothetical protein [Streptococcus equi subsp. zooepidemicus]MCD3432373.1 hypothetical protein [Streptococcus equi subsp. zooepidemicus]MDI5954358.1 hypothetical protein [Streptococcus equi subsp. zooepidemicus]QTZ58337.1 hypothetical protein MCPGFBBE_00436 [Streptococcus equi subsp. zooepidemicus]QUF62890.1 hypothetical protein KCL43_02150 [Streptococcus equi subsp. zooepidemicus]
MKANETIVLQKTMVFLMLFPSIDERFSNVFVIFQHIFFFMRHKNPFIINILLIRQRIMKIFSYFVRFFRKGLIFK